MVTQRTAEKNIRKVFDLATPEDLESGRAWYQEAHDFAVGLSIEYTVPVKAVSHVIAALSPGVRWESNKRAAAELFDAARHVETFPTLPGYTANVRKAWEIARNALYGGKLWETILSGPKVTAFADNILNPPDSNRVTVDVHAISVAEYKIYTVKSAPKLTPRQYEIYVKAYTKVAKSVNLKPSELQAICWVAWRKLVKEWTKKGVK